MGKLFLLVKKETLHIVRDTRTMVITLMMPLILLLLFGFAISTEVSDVKIAAVVDRHNELTADILQRIRVNDYFEFIGLASSSETETLLRTGKADVVLFLKNNNSEIEAQAVVDASNTTSAQAMAGYVQGVLSTGGEGRKSPTLTYTLYNPQMKSSYNFVPGIMGMIFILICAIMTSVSIVREKENGTMNLLLVSPIKASTIILGKLIPYFLLSCVILGAMLLISYTVLGLPFSAGVINVVTVSLIYVILSLSLGLLVSAIANTQLTALIASAVVLMLPVIMLSGMIFPIENMPTVLQGISCIIPARWYIDAMRKIMIQELDLSYVLDDVIILSCMAMALLMTAVRKFRSSTK